MSDDLFRVDHAAGAYLGDEPPDLGPLRALAERAELADAVAGLTDGYGRRLAETDPLADANCELAHCWRRRRQARRAGVERCLQGRSDPTRRVVTLGPARVRGAARQFSTSWLLGSYYELCGVVRT